MGFKIETHIKNKDIVRDKSSLQSVLETEIELFGKSFSNKKKFNFYLELGVLLKAGITLKESLQIILENQKKKSDKSLFENILKEIISGKSFSEVLGDTGKFSNYEFYSIKIGEESGNLAKIIQQLALFYEKRIEQRRVVVAALTYPVIILTTAVIVIIFMLSYVVPMFQDIFRQNNVELPWITEVIINTSSFVRNYLWVIFLVLLCLIISYRFFKKDKKIRKITDYLLLKIPVFGSFISKVYLAQFTQAVSLLTSSKIPMLNSIQLVGKMINFSPLKDDLLKVEDKILEGFSLNESLKSTRMFDNRMIALVKVSEETNQTNFIFNQLNEQYSQEVTQQSKVMSTILEPFIILIVGVIVAILLIAMYLPMFQLSNAIG